MATAVTPTGLAAFTANAEAWIEAEWAKIEPYAASFEQAVESDVEIAFEDLAQISLGAVLAQAPAVLSGAEKFGTAVTSVVQTVEAAGKTVAVTTAQTAVQQAYDTIASAVAAKATPPAA